MTDTEYKKRLAGLDRRLSEACDNYDRARKALNRSREQDKTDGVRWSERTTKAARLEGDADTALAQAEFDRHQHVHAHYQRSRTAALTPSTPAR